jgi:hypothetical protein
VRHVHVVLAVVVHLTSAIPPLAIHVIVVDARVKVDVAGRRSSAVEASSAITTTTATHLLRTPLFTVTDAALRDAAVAVRPKCHPADGPCHSDPRATPAHGTPQQPLRDRRQLVRRFHRHVVQHHDDVTRSQPRHVELEVHGLLQRQWVQTVGVDDGQARLVKHVHLVEIAVVAAASIGVQRVAITLHTAVAVRRLESSRQVTQLRVAAARVD